MTTTQIILMLIVLLFVAVITFCIVRSYLKDRTLEQIRGDVYQLILKAEHIYDGSSAGKLKMKYVVQKARLLLPSWMQTIITDELLEKIIQIWFDEVKDLLDDGKVNGSQKN